MRRRAFSYFFVCVLIVGGGTLLSANSGAKQAVGDQGSGNAGGIKNPMDGDADAIRSGKADYDARCASCHRPDAKGTDRGSDLTGVWAAGETVQELAQTIRRGVPNTLLRHSFGPDSNVWSMLAYLKTLNVATSNAGPSGDSNNGRAIFAARCANCHDANSGGVLGPDLSQIGSSRSKPFLAQKIRHASSYIMDEYSGGVVTEGYQPVTLITIDGKKIRGVKKNEDAFSIQIMDSQQRLQGYLKASLRQIVNDTDSLMPDFGENVLSNRDLEDLLAYLGTLRGTRMGRP
jgi:putative heme-binding domain-containing protein